jgi:hypothetical protein
MISPRLDEFNFNWVEFSCSRNRSTMVEEVTVVIPDFLLLIFISITPVFESINNAMYCNSNY